jgi:Protein of unknown function (DUF2939)
MREPFAPYGGSSPPSAWRVVRRPPLAPEWPNASREWLRRPPREKLLRKTILAFVIIGLLWIGYIAWPLRDLAVLVQAIDAHDITSVLDHVNFDRVRVSLAEQVAAALRREGPASNQFPFRSRQSLPA